MARFLIDTDVLIDHERGVPQARDYLLSINTEQNQLFLSVVTLTELFAGLKADHRRQSEPLISGFEVVVMDRPIAEQAADYLHRYQKKIHLGLGDAVIAATAHRLKASIVTRKIKHFPMPDVTVVEPYSIR